MRDRLIALIKEAERKFSDTGRPVLDIEEYVADHLLANGVIVPPIRMGQKVYTIGWCDNVEEWEVIAVKHEAYVDESRWRFVARLGMASDIAFTDEFFGKTVFLTREEAEKALAERRANDEQAD